MNTFAPHRILTRRLGALPFDISDDIIAPGPFLPLAPALPPAAPPAAPAPIPSVPIQISPFRPGFQPQAAPEPTPEPSREYALPVEPGTSPLVYVGIAVAGTLALIAILR